MVIIIDKNHVNFKEPSVSVDTETDDLIRQVIKDNFTDRTVIILANRFRLIVQMDRILVMDHGRVVEFDTPIALLDNPKSKFSMMVSQTGDVDPMRLRQLAQSHLDSKSGRRPSIHNDRSFNRDTTSQTTTRSYESQQSLPRSLADIFVSPEMRRSTSNRSASSDLSCASSDAKDLGTTEVLELADIRPDPERLRPETEFQSSQRSLLKNHLKDQYLSSQHQAKSNHPPQPPPSSS